MAKALLVTIDIPMGSKILHVLDEAGVKPSVFLWGYLADYDDWRLLIASKQLDAAGKHDGYGRVNKAIRSSGIGGWELPSLMIMSMNDPFIRELRKLFGKTGNVEGMRVGGQTFGSRYIEDGYVYRIV